MKIHVGNENQFNINSNSCFCQTNDDYSNINPFCLSHSRSRSIAFSFLIIHDDNYTEEVENNPFSLVFFVIY